MLFGDASCAIIDVVALVVHNAVFGGEIMISFSRWDPFPINTSCCTDVKCMQNDEESEYISSSYKNNYLRSYKTNFQRFCIPAILPVLTISQQKH